MFNIGNFFEKFKRIYKDESDKKEKVISLIREITNITLDLSKITIKDGVLQIKASPIIRNEINMKKPDILKGLSQVGLGDIEDIR